VNTKILEEIGLTNTGVKIYLALLELGQSTTGPIIKKTNIQSSVVYHSLERLIQKGLISYAIIKNKKHFEAISPEKLINFLDEKKREIKEILPQLLSLKKESKPNQKSKTIEGIRGIKAVFEDIMQELSKNDELLILGAPKSVNEKIDGFLFDFHKRAKKKRIKIKMIANKNKKEFVKERLKFNLYEVRFMDNNIITPAWTMIYKDKTVIMTVEEEPISFIMINQKVADSYKQYFNLIWKISK